MSINCSKQYETDITKELVTVDTDTTNNRVEYVWTKTGDNNWVGPSIWAMYSKDAREILWRWKVTHENNIDNIILEMYKEYEL